MDPDLFPVTVPSVRTKVQVACAISPGMFKDEWLIILDGGESYYCPKDKVAVQRAPSRLQPGAGSVSGYLVQEFEGTSLVELDAIEISHSRRVEVPKSAITVPE